MNAVMKMQCGVHSPPQSSGGRALGMEATPEKALAMVHRRMWSGVFDVDENWSCGHELAETSAFLGKMRDMMFVCKASTNRRDVWKLTVYRATSRSSTAVETKQLTILQRAINYYGCDTVSNHSAPRQIVAALEGRLMENDWIVAMKSLLCVHSLLRETANPSFVQLVIDRREALFDLEEFCDPNSKATRFNSLVKAYARYLMQYVSTKRAINYPPVKNNLLDLSANNETSFPLRFAGHDVDTLFTEADLLADVITALCEVSMKGIEKMCIVACLRRNLARDSGHYWPSLVRCLEQLLQRVKEDDARLKDLLCRYDELSSTFDLFAAKMSREEICWPQPEVSSVAELCDNFV